MSGGARRGGPLRMPLDGGRLLSHGLPAVPWALSLGPGLDETPGRSPMAAAHEGIHSEGVQRALAAQHDSNDPLHAAGFRDWAFPRGGLLMKGKSRAFRRLVCWLG